jgi:hypothetical protein
MNTENIIDDTVALNISIKEEVKLKNKQLIRRAAVLAVITSILFIIVMSYSNDMPLKDLLMTGVIGNLIGIPLTSLILALVFAFIPYRGLSWQEKYLRTALLIMIVWNAFYSSAMLLTAAILIYKYSITP